MSDDSNNLIERKCAECGEPVETTPVYHTECLDHDVPDLDDLHSEKLIQESDLRALIEEWRGNPSFEVTQDAPYQAIKQCADGLEALLNGENNE